VGRRILASALPAPGCRCPSDSETAGRGSTSHDPASSRQSQGSPATHHGHERPGARAPAAENSVLHGTTRWEASERPTPCGQSGPDQALRLADDDRSGPRRSGQAGHGGYGATRMASRSPRAGCTMLRKGPLGQAHALPGPAARGRAAPPQSGWAAIPQAPAAPDHGPCSDTGRLSGVRRGAAGSARLLTMESRLAKPWGRGVAFPDAAVGRRSPRPGILRAWTLNPPSRGPRVESARIGRSPVQERQQGVRQGRPRRGPP
jgi:hypothetical protein